jgi:hypothetical protein
MIELVYWSFAVAVVPMILDLGARILTATAALYRWTSDRMTEHTRNGWRPMQAVADRSVH